MSYQFIHVESYSKKPSTKAKPNNKKFEKKSLKTSDVQNSSQRTTHNSPDAAGSGHGAPQKPRASVQEVINEAIREVGYCPHVDSPQPPTFLLGDINELKNIPLQIEMNIEVHMAKTKTRRPRSDGHTLLAGTSSYSRDMMDEDPERYQKWKKATVNYLKEKYGKNLKVVLEHLDEDHPHIHFYAIGQGAETNAKLLHDGHREALALYKPVTQDYDRVFKETMVKYQSDYFEKVTHSIGLLRDGPRRKRTDKATHEAAKRSANETYALDCKSVDRALDLDLKAHELLNERVLLVNEFNEHMTTQNAEYTRVTTASNDELTKAWNFVENKNKELDARIANIDVEIEAKALPMAEKMAGPIAKGMANRHILKQYETELESIPDAPTGFFNGEKWLKVYETMKHIIKEQSKKLATSDRAVEFARETYEVRAQESFKSVERVKELTEQVTQLLESDKKEATFMNYCEQWMPAQMEALRFQMTYAKANLAVRCSTYSTFQKHLPALTAVNPDMAQATATKLHLSNGPGDGSYFSPSDMMDYTQTRTKKHVQE